MKQPSQPVRDDRALLESLVEQMAARLRAYVLRVWPGCDAEELVAETFCRAAENVAALRTTPRPDLYLLRTARNLCLDARRKRAPRLRTTEWLDVQASGAPADPARDLMEDEVSAVLRREVEALPEAQREIVVLRYTVGLQFSEIAECLGIPLGTALSRSHAAMAKLRNRLETSHVPQ